MKYIAFLLLFLANYALSLLMGEGLFYHLQERVFVYDWHAKLLGLLEFGRPHVVAGEYE